MISTYVFPPPGGVAQYVATLADAFFRANHDVTVVTTSRDVVRGLAYEVVNVRSVDNLTRIYASADILLLSNLSLRLAYPMLWSDREFGLFHHSTGMAQLGQNPLDLLKRSIASKATHFVASAYVGRAIAAPFQVIHPFANLENLARHIPMPLAERRSALFCGRLVREKGIMYLLDRWPAAQDILGVEELRIVGDGPLRGEIESRLTAGALKNVRVLGILPSKDTAGEMARAAYLIVPSLWEEPFGAVALEGLAAGAMIVLSDRGGLPETTGALGHFFNPDDPESFGRALFQARERRRNLQDSADAMNAYRLEVDRHVLRFSPTSAVNSILSALGNAKAPKRDDGSAGDTPHRHVA